mmetsp:Transcript_33242/g.99001  ORF Transcript_33242/g.99001 Transcript_33242/m.99001 type:complete len:214 (-) Transcript_33242:149-790(-)
MRSVALLPQELQRAHKRARTHLPSVHVAPLVDLERKVTIALHPLRKHVIDDRLGCWAHDQRLLEILAAAFGDDGQLRRKALHMVSLFRDERHWDELREVAVFVARLLKALIEVGLDGLPHSKAIRLHHHGAPHRPIVCKPGTRHHVQVPTAEVHTKRRDGLFARLFATLAALLLLPLLSFGLLFLAIFLPDLLSGRVRFRRLRGRRVGRCGAA